VKSVMTSVEFENGARKLLDGQRRAYQAGQTPNLDRYGLPLTVDEPD
jgi:hypothetical protein